MSASKRNKRKGREQRRPVVRDPDGTRNALIEAALALFERHGYAAASVQRIVDDAGLTKGAFYHHFNSKDDLLYEIHDEFVSEQLERAKDIMASELSPDEMLRQLIVEALMEPLGTYRREIAVFVQEYRFLEREIFDEIKVKRDEYERCFVDVVKRGMDDGVFRRMGPPRILAFGVIGMCAWAHTWLDASGSLSAREIGEIYADIVVDGLRTGAAPGAIRASVQSVASGADT
jgi:AcrR family transcriptional regulator